MIKTFKHFDIYERAVVSTLFQPKERSNKNSTKGKQAMGFGVYKTTPSIFELQESGTTYQLTLSKPPV